MDDDSKALYICLAMGLIEMVLTDEVDTKPRGARATALKSLYDRCDKIIDYYRLVSWPLEKQLLAGTTLERIEKIIEGTWSPKLVGRDEKGRFCKA